MLDVSLFVVESYDLSAAFSLTIKAILLLSRIFKYKYLN